MIRRSRQTKTNQAFDRFDNLGKATLQLLAGKLASLGCVRVLAVLVAHFLRAVVGVATSTLNGKNKV